MHPGRGFDGREDRDRAGDAAAASAGPSAGSAAVELSRLRARERQMRTVADLGLEALGAPALGVLLDRAVQNVAGALAVEIVAIEESQGGGDLLVHAAVGVVKDVLGHQQAGAGEGSQAGYTLRAGVPVITEDLLSEARFRPAAVLTGSEVVRAVA